MDYIVVRCGCKGGLIRFESHLGPGRHSNYTIHNAPVSVFLDLVGSTKSCGECGMSAFITGTVDKPEVSFGQVFYNQRRISTMLFKDQILNRDICAMSLDDLQLFFVQLKNIAAGFQDKSVNIALSGDLGAPMWLVNRLQDVELEFASRVRAERQHQLSVLKSQRESYRSREEKATILDAQIAEIQKSLGI